MSRVITFSRYFPAYHPKAGQPTYFVEQIYHSICTGNPSKFFDEVPIELGWLNPFVSGAKHHTIRSGNRWKVGDKFSPRVWSGKPYNSKQIIIAPDITIKKVWEFQLLGGQPMIKTNGAGWRFISDKFLTEIALNDGLTMDDMVAWFHDFSNNMQGQIICWNEYVNY